jgi:hypothetical protein
MRLPILISLAVTTLLAAACAGAASVQPVGPPASFQRVVVPHVASDAQTALWPISILPRSIRAQVSGYARRHTYKDLPDKRMGKEPSEWVTDGSGYIWGVKGKKVTAYFTDCAFPGGARVDHMGNLIVACNGSATINIYRAANLTGPANVVLNDTAGYYPTDVSIDPAGDIYAANIYGIVGSQTLDGNVVWWTPSNQASGASPSGSYQDPNMSQVFFIDSDLGGNVYVDGFNQTGYPEVDEIASLLASPNPSNLGLSLQFPGGVYVSNKGTVLNVLDQVGTKGPVISQYTLPPPLGAPFNTLKMLNNIRKNCDPVGIGFNKGDTEVGDADIGCHAIGTGKLPSDTERDTFNPNFSTPNGFAFVPSDK